MPLHDWSKLAEWEGVHQLWISELYYAIRAQLPPGYRAGLGTVPSLTIGAQPTKPEVSVHEASTRNWQPPISNGNALGQSEFAEEVTVLTLDPSMMVQVYRQRDLVSVFELISPANKDREATRIVTRDRIIGYLMLGIHVAYVDVHPQPYDCSLADFVAQALAFAQGPLPAPHAWSVRVGTPPDKGGRSLAVQRTPFAIGQPLPGMGLPLSREITIPIDLDATYSKVTGSYLSWLPSLNGHDSSN